MRTFVSCITAAVVLVTGATSADRAEADLIRLKSGGEIRCTTIWKTGTMVNCAWASGNMSFPETIIQEIIYDDHAGYASTPNSAPVLEAKTYREGTREHALVQAVAKGDVDAVIKLIEDRADINGLYHWSPNIVAPPGSHGAVVRIPETAESHHSGLTPLMLAASGGNTAMVRLLLERGANPNLRKSLDDKGVSSALCRAVRASSSNQETVRLILSRNPDTESIETAFVSMADDKYRLKEYLDIFLAHGVSDQCRQRALMRAKKNGIGYTARILEEAYRKHDESAKKKQ